jgi:hypothetical protein
MICTVCTLGIVAIAPNVGRLSRHICFTRLKGFGSDMATPWSEFGEFYHGS